MSRLCEVDIIRWTSQLVVENKFLCVFTHLSGLNWTWFLFDGFYPARSGQIAINLLLWRLGHSVGDFLWRLLIAWKFRINVPRWLLINDLLLVANFWRECGRGGGLSHFSRLIVPQLQSSPVIGYITEIVFLRYQPRSGHSRGKVGKFQSNTWISSTSLVLGYDFRSRVYWIMALITP